MELADLYRVDAALAATGKLAAKKAIPQRPKPETFCPVCGTT